MNTLLIGIMLIAFLFVANYLIVQAKNATECEDQNMEL
jgi:hypothetical protein